MKAKHILAVAALIFCGAVGAQAQTRHEIGISYGVGSNSTILSSLEDLTEIPATLGTVKYDKEKNFGPIAVEYFYHLSEKVGIGGIVSYVNTKKDALVAGAKVGDAKINFITVMPAVKLDWFQRESFGMYSKLAAGVSFRNEKQDWADVSESSVEFNFQASLVGLEVGSPNVRGFLELGFGEQGIALAGVRFKMP